MGGTKFQLENDTYARGRNAADDGDVNIIKVNANDLLELGANLDSLDVINDVTVGGTLDVTGDTTLASASADSMSSENHILTPVSADPSSPVEGQVQFSDGTARAKGFYVYQDGEWVSYSPQAGNAPNTRYVSSGGTQSMQTTDEFVTFATSATYQLLDPANYQGRSLYLNVRDGSTVTVEYDSNTIVELDTRFKRNTNDNFCVVRSVEAGFGSGNWQWTLTSVPKTLSTTKYLSSDLSSNSTIVDYELNNLIAGKTYELIIKNRANNDSVNVQPLLTFGEFETFENILDQVFGTSSKVIRFTAPTDNGNGETYSGNIRFNFFSNGGTLWGDGSIYGSSVTLKQIDDEIEGGF